MTISRSRRSSDRPGWGRREVLQALGVLVAGAATPAWAQAKPLRIGIIGTGRIGGALATHWTRAGHEVLMSSRHPEELRPLATSLGARARVGIPREAVAFGEVVLVSVPYAAIPDIGKENAAALKGKVVLDTSNPVENRDGAMALAAQKKGAGVATAEFLPGTRVVRAFNCIPAASLAIWVMNTVRIGNGISTPARCAPYQMRVRTSPSMGFSRWTSSIQ